MFRPNQNCTIIAKTGSDVYGQPITSVKSRERCAVVRLVNTNQASSVRADTSATRGNAKEVVTDSLILLAKTTQAAFDDLIQVAGMTLRIVSMRPQFNVRGELDHYEATAQLRSDA